MEDGTESLVCRISKLDFEKENPSAVLFMKMVAVRGNPELSDGIYRFFYFLNGKTVCLSARSGGDYNFYEIHDLDTVVDRFKRSPRLFGFEFVI